MLFLKVGFCGVVRVCYVIIHTGSRLFVIFGKYIAGRGIGNGPRLTLNLPKIQMLKDLLDHNRVLKRRNALFSQGLWQFRPWGVILQLYELRVL